MSWLGKLFGRKSIDPETRVVARFEGRIDGEFDPVGKGFATEADLQSSMELLATLSDSDGVRLDEKVRLAQIPEIIEWLGPTNLDPTPRALARLLVDGTQKQLAWSEMVSIFAFWMPGQFPKSSWDGPATFAKIIGIRIRVFYKEPGSDKHLVMDFEP